MSMRFFWKILFAFTIAITLGGKPVIDMMVYDTIVMVTEENEEEETVHKDASKEWKFVKRVTIVDPASMDDDELVHNYYTQSLVPLFKGSISPQPPEFV